MWPTLTNLQTADDRLNLKSSHNFRPEIGNERSCIQFQNLDFSDIGAQSRRNSETVRPTICEKRSPITSRHHSDVTSFKWRNFIGIQSWSVKSLSARLGSSYEESHGCPHPQATSSTKVHWKRFDRVPISEVGGDFNGKPEAHGGQRTKKKWIIAKGRRGSKDELGPRGLVRAWR
jgi:hypothetical protein